MRSHQSYFGATVILGSQHEKEIAIAPVLKKELGITLKTTKWDTDVLGTFSGEIKREKTIRDTLRAKANKTHEICKQPLILVSEGSFGSHPHLPLVPSNHEMLLLKDYEHNREIFAETISTQTNINELEVGDFKDVEGFLVKSKFPSHAMMVLDKKDKPAHIVKGITSKEELFKLLDQFRKMYGSVYLTTDMRAHMNPMRLEVIAQATRELINKIKTCCPKCHAPAFDIVDFIIGLPCSTCGSPSTMVKELLYQCHDCGFREHRPRQDKKTHIPADHCEFCNP